MGRTTTYCRPWTLFVASAIYWFYLISFSAPALIIDCPLLFAVCVLVYNFPRFLSLFWFVLRILRHFFRFYVGCCRCCCCRWPRPVNPGTTKLLKFYCYLCPLCEKIFKLFLLFLYILLLNCLLLVESGKCVCRVLCWEKSQWCCFPLSLSFFSLLLSLFKYYSCRLYWQHWNLRAQNLLNFALSISFKFICRYFYYVCTLFVLAGCFILMENIIWYCGFFKIYLVYFYKSLCNLIWNFLEFQNIF